MRDVLRYIIGKGGETIKRLKNESGAYLGFEPLESAPNRYELRIRGDSTERAKVLPLFSPCVLHHCT